MLKLPVQNLADAIRRNIPSMSVDSAMKMAGDIVRDTDERLENNVAQWMEGEPLTDDWVDKYCIGAILAIRGDTDFLDALRAMSRYIEDPVAGEHLIWRKRA